MKRILSFLGALLGAAVGTYFGTFMVFTDSQPEGLHPTADELTMPIFLGIALSGLVIALVWSQMSREGFWVSLVATAFVGLIYPMFLWWLYVFVIIAAIPFIVIWHYKEYALLIAIIGIVIAIVRTDW